MRVVAEAKRELEEPASAKAQMLLQFSNLQILRESSSENNKIIQIMGTVKRNLQVPRHK